MEKNEVVILKLDSSNAEEGIAEINEGLKETKNLVGEIGKAMSKTFAPIHRGLQKLETSIYALSDGLEAATVALQGLIVQFSAMQWGETLQNEITAAGEAFSFIEVSAQAAIEGIAGSVATFGVESGIAAITGALGATVSTGGLLGIIAAVAVEIAAIALLIANWDSIQAAVTEGFSAFMDSAGGAWESVYNIIQPVIDFFRTTINDLWENHLKPFWDNLCAAFKSIGEGITTIWNEILMPVINWIIGILAPAIVSVIDIIIGAVSIVVGFIADVIGGIFEVVGGLIKFIAGVFTGDWEKAWEGVVEIFKGVFDGIAGIVKGVFNGIIWAINILIAAIYSAIAGVLNGIGGVAKFIGNIFGQDWGFSVPSNPPQIPYLAKGAVLPANRPFLAMVGDQRHGTNVEAPLTTIQEAVALVMQDQTAAILSGFQASIGVQREILEAVLGIQIGDDIIGSAAARYQRKMAVAMGGF